MSWADDLQQATYRGIVFECLAIDDETEKALVEHRYPYVEGGDIEDMGTGPRRVSVQAFFWGDSYEQALETFVAALEATGSAEFIHPIFGSMPAVQVARFKVHHEADGVDQGQVDFELVNSKAGGAFFADLTALQSAQGVSQQTAAARLASSNAFNTLMLKLKAANPMNQLVLLRQEMMGPIIDAQIMASYISSSALDVISYPSSWISDLTSAASGVANIGNFAAGSLQASYNTAFSQLSAVFATGSNVITVNGNTPSQADAMQAAGVHISVELSSTVADCATAVFASEATTPTLSPRQIESITNSTRGQIESTIELIELAYPAQMGWPIIEALKNVALAVQQSAASIIDSRPPIITRQVITPVPLRLLAFLWYSDHTRATQLMLLNELPNPNFLLASDELVCYAN